MSGYKSFEPFFNKNVAIRSKSGKVNIGVLDDYSSDFDNEFGEAVYIKTSQGFVIEYLTKDIVSIEEVYGVQKQAV